MPGCHWNLCLDLLLRIDVSLDVSAINKDCLGRKIACICYFVQYPVKYLIYRFSSEAMPEIIAYRRKMRRFLL